MVQLKAQELEHRECVEQLKGQVAWHPLSPCSPPALCSLQEGWHLFTKYLGGSHMLAAQP